MTPTLLKYHVLAGKVAAAAVAKLDGKTDIAASNGRMPVVDTVLMPK